MRAMVLPDVFQDHDTPAAMYARAGLDAKAPPANASEESSSEEKKEGEGEGAGSRHGELLVRGPA